MINPIGEADISALLREDVLALGEFDLKRDIGTSGYAGAERLARFARKTSSGV
jgi:hypothetical protein